MNRADSQALLNESYPEWASMSLDEQVKVCHHCCSDTGCADHKARLYIKRIGHDTWVFNCFNCGDHGFYQEKEAFSPIKNPGDESPIMVPYASAWEAMYNRADTNITSDEMRLWLAKYDMLVFASAYGIRQDTGRLYLPIWDGAKRVGLQARMFATGPKYLTWKESGSSVCHLTGHDKHPLYIVEDLLSAYKLHSSGRNVVALMGTHISNLPTNYDKAIVWLDDDLAGHAGALDIYRQIQPLYKHVDCLFHKQPKECTFEELRGYP